MTERSIAVRQLVQSTLVSIGGVLLCAAIIGEGAPTGWLVGGAIILFLVRMIL